MFFPGMVGFSTVSIHGSGARRSVISLSTFSFCKTKGGLMESPGKDPTRNLALELARVTEAASLAAGRFMGRGDKEAADDAAVNAMRNVLQTVDMNGIIVIGEGEKDNAPM